ncbi:MAG: ABC transporter permease [Acidobacteriota bacterium]|jgi:putative ABC transport system permease protein
MNLVRQVRASVDALRFAFGSLRTHKTRSFLTVLGIVVGVTTVIAMVGVIEGFNRNVISSFQAFGSTLVQFQKYDPRFGGGPGIPEEQRRRRNLTLDDAMAIKELAPSIAAVSPERYLFQAAASLTLRYRGREAQGPNVVGAAPDYPLANNHFVARGRFITEADLQHRTHVCAIGPDLVEALFPHEDPLEREVMLEGRRFRVVGVMEPKGSQFFASQDNFFFIPFSTFDHYFPWVKNGHGDTIHIATVPKKPEWVPRAIEEGTAILRQRRGLRFGEENDFAVMTPQRIIDQFQQVTAGIYLAMIFISAIGLLVGGVGVMNIMLVSVTERTREIGLRKAVGARRADLLGQFLMEAGTLTGLGGVVGVGVGLAAVGGIRASGLLPAAAPIWAIGLGFCVSVAVGLVFGMYPAVRASRLDPIEALRHE